MKTILIAHNYTEVSFSAMSCSLANHLASLGYQVVFISHQPYFIKEQFIHKDNGKIIVCSWPTTKRPTSLSDFLWYCKIYLKYKPEVVIGHFVGSNITISASKLLSFGRVKTFEYYHTLRSQLFMDMKKVTLRQKLLFLRKKIFYKLYCDIIVCPSELAKSDLESFYGNKKGVVLLNPMMDRFLDKKPLMKDSIIVSYLGRLDPSKGIIDLIEAYKVYKERVVNSKITLRVAGTGSQVVKIQELVKNNPEIEYLGALQYDAIDDYLSGSNFTIIPSKFDNLPTVGLESMMNQTPLLISNTTGLADYLTDGKECFKFEPNLDSIVSLFDKIENNFNLYEQMSFDARATYLDKFSMDTYCNTFYQAIL